VRLAKELSGGAGASLYQLTRRIEDIADSVSERIKEIPDSDVGAYGKRLEKVISVMEQISGDIDTSARARGKGDVEIERSSGGVWIAEGPHRAMYFGDREMISRAMKVHSKVKIESNGTKFILLFPSRKSAKQFYESEGYNVK